MKRLHFYCFLVIVLILAGPQIQVKAQAPVHITAEQEAANQTGRLRQALGLSSLQVKKIYDINLRYARLRQLSNSPTAEMELMKKKNIEIANLLTDPQCERFCEFISSHNHSESIKRVDRERGSSGSGIPGGKKNAPKEASKKTNEVRVQKNDSSLGQVLDKVD